MSTETGPDTREHDGINAAYSAAGLLDETAVSTKRANKRGEQTRDKLVKAATECFTEYG